MITKQKRKNNNYLLNEEIDALIREIDKLPNSFKTANNTQFNNTDKSLVKQIVNDILSLPDGEVSPMVYNIIIKYIT